MKKFICRLVFALCATIALSGCEGVIGPGSLEGTWDLIKQEVKKDGKVYDTGDVSSSSIVFEDTYLIIHDPEDVFDGKKIEYEYKEGYIWIMGVEWFEVISLEKSILKLGIDQYDGSNLILTYKKR
ncbi:MAG: hypothetical protein IKV32_02300 [Muribaculaceae bacterium]|nr:hypothetical protein [Muribaculaceae bacterium]